MASAVAQAINDPVLSIYLFDIERLFKREASGLLSARELVIVDPIVMGSARRAETASISAGVPALEDWTRTNSRPSGAGAASLAPLRAAMATCTKRRAVLRFAPVRVFCTVTWETQMTWKTPKIVEVPVGMEINMYACAARK